MKRTPVLISLAVLLALIGTVAVYSYVHGANRRAVNGMNPVSVLVVTKQIPAGTAWSTVAAGGYVATESVPGSAAPSSPIVSTSAAIPAAQAATFAIQPGQILVREMFAEKSPMTGALAIPGQLQAVTITLPSTADVAGFVQNGSQVAVYAIVQTRHQVDSAQLVGPEQYSSKLLLPRVNVLAVSQSAPNTANGSTSSSSSAGVLVTLAVSQQQAERLVLAQKVGDLYLSLLTGSSATAEDGGTIGLGIFNPTPLFTR